MQRRACKGHKRDQEIEYNKYFKDKVNTITFFGIKFSKRGSCIFYKVQLFFRVGRINDMAIINFNVNDSKWTCKWILNGIKIIKRTLARDKRNSKVNKIGSCVWMGIQQSRIFNRIFDIFVH